MADGLPLKLLEGLALLAAVVAFGWWQLRDVKRAQEKTRKTEAQQDNARGGDASPGGDGGGD
jgi:hypothetical protein